MAVLTHNDYVAARARFVAHMQAAIRGSDSWERALRFIKLGVDPTNLPVEHATYTALRSIYVSYLGQGIGGLQYFDKLTQMAYLGLAI
jgi:hypothetical protein